MAWQLARHVHVHGNHTHTHEHYADPTEREMHEHGWHDPPEAPPGATDFDDTFGEEPLSARKPSGQVGPQLAAAGKAPLIVTPYVPGMLRADIGAPGVFWLKVDVSGSQYDYWDLLVRLFRRGLPFVLVEQDMMPTPAQLEELWSCQEPWCGISYEVWQGDVVQFYGDLGALGCVKFDLPSLAEDLATLGPVTWSRLDGMVYGAARAKGLRPHVHPGQVVHLHDYGQPAPAVPVAANGCCTMADYADLSIVHPWLSWLRTELDDWHRDYLPVHGTVLDVGAGCGETAAFYLRHGASHVVAVEGDPIALDHLRENFGDDPRVTIVAAQIDKVKVDIEGAEEGMDLEVHFPFRWEVGRRVGTIVQQRLVREVT